MHPTENKYQGIELTIVFVFMFLVGGLLFLSKITIISIFLLAIITLGFGSTITVLFLQWTDVGVRANDRLFRLKWWDSIFLSMISVVPFGMFSIFLFLLINFWAASGPTRIITRPIIERGESSKYGPYIKVDINKEKSYTHYIDDSKEINSKYLDLTIQKGFFGIWVVKKESTRFFMPADLLQK